MLTIPKRLSPGDTIGLITPASPPVDPTSIDRSVDMLKQWGFKVKLARNARKRLGYLAGTDRERAGDIMDMFTDRKVNAIMCSRGGYGTSRLFPLLDYQLIRKNPKVFAGYSDLTSLHFAFLKLSNLLTFHSPMTTTDFLQKDYPKFSVDRFLKMVTDPTPYGSISQGYDQNTVSILRRGKVSGELIGGNMSLITTAVGTKYAPSFRGKILFFEDVDEKPFRVDRMLTFLLNLGILQQVAGIAIGLCADCEDPKAKTAKEYRQTLRDVFVDRLVPLKIPIVMDLPFGHVPYNATLPVGGRATLDANKGDLILTSSAVS